MGVKLGRQLGGKLVAALRGASFRGANLKGLLMNRALITGASIIGVIVVMMWPDLHAAFCAGKV